MLASFTNKIKTFRHETMCDYSFLLVSTSDKIGYENIFVVILTLNETTIRGTISSRLFLTWQ